MYQLRTTRGYELAAVVSAMQKAIRRGDARVAGYFALEMCASGFDQYCWRRLLTISAEDCWGILTQEVKALQDAYKALTKGRTKEANKTDMTGWVCVAKAVILMAEAKKSRDADHLVCFIYDQQRIDAEALAQALAEADPEPIPEVSPALVHTSFLLMRRSRGRPVRRDGRVAEVAVWNTAPAQELAVGDQ